MHHGFSELHQLDTFYNALNSNDQDSLNSAVGGNFLDKMPRDCLRIIESKSKVHNSRNKLVVAKVSSNSSTPGISPDVAELKDMVKALLLDKKNQTQAPVPVKAAEESCVTCGGAHSYRNCPATDGNVYRDNIQEYVSRGSIHLFEIAYKHSIKSASVKVNTGEVNTAAVNTGEVNTAQVNTAELNLDSTPSAQVNTGEVNAAQVNTGEVNAAEVNTGEAERVQRRKGKEP
ncbi:hypothetical protein Tco_0048493, partial [Tanacetum coccineum]